MVRLGILRNFSQVWNHWGVKLEQVLFDPLMIWKSHTSWPFLEALLEKPSSQTSRNPPVSFGYRASEPHDRRCDWLNLRVQGQVRNSPGSRTGTWKVPPDFFHGLNHGRHPVNHPKSGMILGLTSSSHSWNMLKLTICHEHWRFFKHPVDVSDYVGLQSPTVSWVDWSCLHKLYSCSIRFVTHLCSEWCFYINFTKHGLKMGVPRNHPF